MADYKFIKVTYAEQIARVTLNNPDKRNFFNEDVWLEMLDCQREIALADDVRVVVIDAAGAHFSTGIELSFLRRAGGQDVMRKLPTFQKAFSGWEELSVPVIAAIQGCCFGNATDLILACDLRIAARNANFAIQEVRVAGLAPDFGGTTRLPRLVGLGAAKRLILTGEQIDAAEAYRIGLAEYLVDDADLYEASMTLARKIAQCPPIGMMMAKKGLNLALESSRAASMQFEQVQAMFCCQTEDQKESLAAIMEKRTPVFQGK